MKANVIDDPYLEFQARNQHRDPRHGVGVYGPAAAIDGMRGWLERCQTRIEAKQAKAGQENRPRSPPPDQDPRGWSQDTRRAAAPGLPPRLYYLRTGQTLTRRGSRARSMSRGIRTVGWSHLGPTVVPPWPAAKKMTWHNARYSNPEPAD